MQTTVWHYIQLAKLYEERGQLERARIVRLSALVEMVREDDSSLQFDVPNSNVAASFAARAGAN